VKKREREEVKFMRCKLNTIDKFGFNVQNYHPHWLEDFFLASEQLE